VHKLDLITEGEKGIANLGNPFQLLE